MTVYVDNGLIAQGGGHLQADTAWELHAFAVRLGLAHSSFQSKLGQPELDHYVCTRHAREEALRLGAVDEDLISAGMRRMRACRERGKNMEEQALKRFHAERIAAAREAERALLEEETDGC